MALPKLVNQFVIENGLVTSERFTATPLTGGVASDIWRIDTLSAWVNTYPILSIEDPVAEDDTAGFVEFVNCWGSSMQIIGDDFLVTNAQRVLNAANNRAANAVLIKPNQACTITETKAALDAAKQVGFSTIVSARSGETEDVTISHLSVGWNARQLKVGSFSRSERMAKWNECLRIEESIGAAARFAGGAGIFSNKG